MARKSRELHHWSGRYDAIGVQATPAPVDRQVMTHRTKVTTAIKLYIGDTGSALNADRL